MNEIIGIDITLETEEAFLVDICVEEVEPYIIEIELGECCNDGGTGGLEWIKINSDITAESNKGYIIEQSDDPLTVTLPDEGDSYVVRVAGRSSNGWRITPPVGGKIIWMDEDNIFLLQSGLPHDSVELLAIDPGVYMVISSIGNINYSN